MIRIFADYLALSEAAADAVFAAAKRCIAQHGKFILVLSGGQTPKETFSILVHRTAHRHRIWDKTHIYWADERCVPPDDPRSNYRMAKEVFLDLIDIPSENIHRIQAEAPDPAFAAEHYDVEFPSQPDFLILGMGVDGHTASLFPHSPALQEKQKRFVFVETPADPSHRITMTPPAVASAAEIFILVAGTEKAPALQKVFSETGSIDETPARLVHNAIWLVDRQAAQPITKTIIIDAN